MKIRLINNLLIICLIISFSQAFAQKSDSSYIKLNKVEFAAGLFDFRNIPDFYLIGLNWDVKLQKVKRNFDFRILYGRYKSYEYFKPYKRYQYSYNEIINAMYFGPSINLLKKSKYFKLNVGAEFHLHYTETTRLVYQTDYKWFDGRLFFGLNTMIKFELFSNKRINIGIELPSLGLSSVFEKIYGNDLGGEQRFFGVSLPSFRVSRPFCFSINYRF
jgi:hypothetical protein